MNRLKTNMNGNKAITLIALVITIVVLIILAGVVINMTIGSDGLITRTKNAKIQQARETVKEQLLLAVAQGDMDTLTYNANTKKEAYLKALNERSITVDSSTDETIEGTYTVNGMEFQYEITNETGAIKINGEEVSAGSVPNSTPLTATITSDQIWDVQWSRNGTTTTISGLKDAYRKNGSQERLTTGHYLKFTSLGTFSTDNYPEVRLDEYDANGNFVAQYSEKGTLYMLSEERRIYHFTTSYYGYVVCLIPEEATALKASNGGTFQNCQNVTTLD